ncbi:MAG: hypothetical protein AB1733_01890 [Thermodesulfobacteriota bacterium]
MTRTRIIALTAGAVTTFVVLGTALWIMIFGDVFPEKERFVMIFVALAPLAMCSVMVGYAVWWLAVFLLTLCGFDSGTVFGAGEKNREDDS